MMTGATILSLPLVEITPLENPYVFAVFVVFTGLMIVFNLKDGVTKKGGGIFFPALLSASILFSLPVAYLNGTDPMDWFMRGAVPFLFFLIFYIFAFAKDDVFIIRMLFYAGLVWAAKVLVLVAISDTLFAQRYTTVTKDLLVPFNLLGLAIVLYYPQYLPKLMRWLGLLAFVLMTLMAGYRSQFGIVFLMVMIYVFRDLSRGRAFAAASVLTIGSAAVFYFLSTPTGEYFIGRLTGGVEATADWGRYAEIRFALDKFLMSPVFGVGLGTPIPTGVTFAGREAYVQGLVTRYGAGYNVTYMHNIVMYCLMNLGLFGTFAYFGTVFLNWGRKRVQSVLPDRFGAIIALASLVGFNLVAATFTLIHWQVIVALLSALLAARFRVRVPISSDPSIKKRDHRNSFAVSRPML